MRALRVVIVDDERLGRDVSNGVLAGACKLAGTAGYVDAATALERIQELKADVAVVDMEGPGSTNGFELGLRLKEARPEMGVVFLSSDGEPALLEVLQRRRLAGWAYLVKDSLEDPTTLRCALQAAANGEVMVDPAVAARPQARDQSPCARLTHRQREVLELMVRGYSNQGIAEKLCLSRKTVENIITQIYQELGIDSEDPKIQPRVTLVVQYLVETRRVSPILDMAL